jgi:hypothetical protein
MDKSTITKKQRSLAQNRALHKFCELLADELNSAGLEQKVVLSQWIDVQWSKDSVKEVLWKPILKVLSEKSSTTEMDTKEPSEVYEHLVRFFGEKFDLEIPNWPSELETNSYLNSYETKE